MTEEPPRLVIDTNVFVSGLISEAGAPAQILRAIQQKRAVHIVSDPIVEEYLRVLEYPRIRKFQKITDEFIANIAAYLIYRTQRIELGPITAISRDPDDDVFLQTAVDGLAAMVVSGDKADVLSLGTVQGIPIVTAKQASARLGL